jgi:hypothetical protein
LKRDNIASASPGEAEDVLENPHCRVPVQRSHIRVRFVEPLNPIRRHLLVILGGRRKIFRPQPKLRKDLFHRNALAIVLLEPSWPCGDALSIFLGYRLIIDRSVHDRGGIQDRVYGPGNRVDLLRRQPVDQLVQVLA